MKIAIYRTLDSCDPSAAEAVVLGMLRAMVRREPAVPLVAPIEGGAVGAWIEDGEAGERAVASFPDGSFAVVDPHILAPARAAGLLDVVRGRAGSSLRDLDGAFTAVVHDGLARRTTVLTDRFGTRPLYVRQDLRAFACASEAKALLAIPGVEAREDPLAIHDVLNYGWVAGDRTWLEGIRLVDDATAITLERGLPPARARYRDRLFEPGRLSVEEGLEAVPAALEGAIRSLAKLARRAPAVLLSGGLDSRTIASFCARAGVPVHCYTMGPERSAETRGARGIAAALGLPCDRLDIPAEAVPRRAAVLEWIGDGLVSPADLHFADAHVTRIGPDHGDFFEGWIGGVVGGAYYVKEADLAIAGREGLAASMTKMFDGPHATELEDRVLEPAFARRMRGRATESVAEFLDGWEVEPGRGGVAKEAACLRFRDRRWQLYHGGVAVAPFARALRPYVVGEVVERFQALPLEARMDAGFYRRMIREQFAKVATVPWQVTGRAIDAPASPLRARANGWKRRAFHVLCRLSGGRVNLRDMNTYFHPDQAFRTHAPLRSFFADMLENGPVRRGWLAPGGARALLDVERRGGPFFRFLGRLLQAELAARLFLDPQREAERARLVPERIGRVRLRGGAAELRPVRIPLDRRADGVPDAGTGTIAAA